MPKKLVNINVEEISGVDKAANGKKFLVIKNASGDSIPEEFYKRFDIEKSLLNEVLEDSDYQLSNLIEAFWQSVDSITYDWDNSTEDKISELETTADQFKQKLSNISKRAADLLDVDKFCKSYKGGESTMEWEEVLKAIEDEEVRKAVEKKVEDLETQVEKSASDSGEEVDIDKLDVPDSVKKYLKKQESETQAAQEMAKREREARLEVEFNKKAEAYDNVGDTSEIAKVLKKASSLDEDLLSTLESLFKAAQERLEKSELFKEAGDEGEEVEGAEAELEKKAKEYMEKSTDMTYEKAFTKALSENPELYQAYKAGK